MIELRAPTPDDWNAIGIIANASLADVPGAPAQDEWLRNRMTFDDARGSRHHRVAVREGVLRGYAAAEHAPDAAADSYRLFVVTSLADREDVGSALLAWLKVTLVEIKARTAWFVEFANDARFTAFLEADGYREARRFAWSDGTKFVVLWREALFA